MSSRPEFFSWRKAILKSDLPPTTRHVLLTLSCHMNDAGESCYPSISLLCKETGLSNRAVITHLKNAKDLGWIIVGLHGFAGQRWAAHEYFPGWPHHLRSAAESLEKAMNEVHHLKKKVVNVVQEGGERGAEGGERGAKKAVKEVHSSTSVLDTPINTPESTSHTEDGVCANPEIKPGTAGSCCQAMIADGIQGCNPHHPTLLALIQAGATEAEFSYAAQCAIAKGNKTFPYVLGIVRKQREDAAKLVLHKGRLPNKQESIQAQNLSVAATWLPPELKEKNHAS